eukprot:322633_1
MGGLRPHAIGHGGRNSWCVVTKVCVNPFRTSSGGSKSAKKCMSWWRSYELLYLIVLVGIGLIRSCECFGGAGWHDRLGYKTPSRLLMISEKNKKMKYVLDEVEDLTLTKCRNRKTLPMSEEAKMELPIPTVRKIVKRRRTSSKAGVGGSLKEDNVKKESSSPYVKEEAVSNMNDKKDSKSEAEAAAARRRNSKPKKNDMMSQFLYSMGQIDLLTASEEVQLARHIQRGLEYEKIRAEQEKILGRGITYEEWSNIAGMTEEEIRSEMIRAQKARTAMISANLRLVVSIAKRYQNRGMQLPDLVQEGIFGLTRATEKFNPEKGFKFSTYATWWIKQSVLRSIADQGRVIRLPVHVHDFLTAMKRGVAELTAQNLRAPTDEELSRHLECSTQKIEFIREATQGVVSMSLPRNPNSLKEAGPGKMKTLQDQFKCGDQSPEEQSQDSMLKENVKQLLYTLSPREQEVVRLRFGIENGQAHTLEEIGSLFQITRERVRQIESRALNKLRQPYRNYKLKEFMIDSTADRDLNEAQYSV